ncbi:MAG: prenyltransferase [Anaerolineae bacterium]|nr:MAG: prenyltransferase [Anaerolineae bacterium]
MLTRAATSNTPQAILKLTRWQEFWAFTSILTWLGGLLAYEVRGATLDWRLFVVFIANMSAMAYAFMINDIEDAVDDTHDPDRARRNPISSGELSKKVGWTASIIMFALSAICYALAGWRTFVVGATILILAHLYSWHLVRLKARPLVDILSHAMFLSTLLFLAAFFIYTTHIGYLWTMVLGTFLISAYGQLYNQVRDYEADRAARLHNTASILGLRITQILAPASVVGALLGFLAAILMGAFPIWLLPVLIVTIIVVHIALRNVKTDMRGSETDDNIALVQREFLTVVNTLMLVWLIVALIS